MVALSYDEHLKNFYNEKIIYYKKLFIEISQNTQAFNKIPESEYYDEVLFDCIAKNYEVINYIPKEYVTHEMELEAQKQLSLKDPIRTYKFARKI